MHQIETFLNCKIKGHLIEDARILVEYTEFPAEPDVGIMQPYIEINNVTSIKGRPINRILRAMTQKELNYIIDDVAENHFC